MSEETNTALEECRALLRSAQQMADAVSRAELEKAVRENVLVWTGIRAVLKRGAEHLPRELHNSLQSVCDYVLATTMGTDVLTIDQVRSLCELNVQVAQGLWDGQVRRMISDRAYEIWVAEGRQDGRAQEHWLRAEAEIMPYVEAPA